jgi:hypothetical protein
VLSSYRVTNIRSGDTLVRLDSKSDFINFRHLLLWVLILGNIFFKASSAAMAESSFGLKSKNYIWRWEQGPGGCFWRLLWIFSCVLLAIF